MMELIGTERYGNYIASYQTIIRDRNEDNIVLIKTIPMNVKDNNYANIVITLDKSSFMEDARDISKLSEGRVVILDNDGKVVTSSAVIDNLDALTKMEYPKSENAFHMNLDGNNMVISYIPSQITNWKYISVVPSSVFWEKAYYIRTITIFSLIFCLLLGGIVTFVALKRNYNPVNRLINALESIQGVNYDKSKNEYMYIQQLITKLNQDKMEKDRILEQQNRELRAGLLGRLLKGRIEVNVPMKDLFELHNISFCSEYFVVMLFYIEDYSDIFGENDILKSGNDYDKFKMLQFIFTNVVEEIANKNGCIGYMTDAEDVLALILNIDESRKSDARELINKIASEAREFINNHFNINFQVSAGRMHKTIRGIANCYEEALQTLEYKKVLGIDEVIHYKDIVEMPRGEYYYPLEVEYQLINAIRVGNKEHSLEILDSIFKKNFEVTKLSLEVSRCLVFDLIGTMIKTLNEGSNLGQEFLKDLKPIEKLFACKNIIEIKKEMALILTVICEVVNKNRNKTKSKQGDKQLVHNICEYVENNYSDENLTVTSIADNFGIHIVQLSKLFKDSTGEGLADYITKMRLRKAKELLKDSNNIEKVSKTVGYSNIRTFMRVFKKIEGVTPGQFKNTDI